MKRIAALLILLTVHIPSFSQFPVPVDSVYTFIKYNSILRNNVNWDETDSAFQNNIKKATTLKDTMRCFVSVLKSLHDVHSQIYLDNKYYGTWPEFDDTTIAWLKPLNDRSNAETNIIYTKMLTEKIAYVKVPSMQAYGQQQIDDLAKALNDSISQFNLKKIKGFIIDLRLNGGGNMYPMLTGLSSLLGNNTLGYETNIDDSVVRKWELINGNFNIGGYHVTNITATASSVFRSIPVVVLTGPVTKSSGSMTAIAFKGRPKTFFIGEPTADGYTTSTQFFTFANNLVLNFATNFAADRNMKIYKTTVDPDLLIYHGDNFDDLMQDKKIMAALKWLKQNCKK